MAVVIAGACKRSVRRVRQPCPGQADRLVGIALRLHVLDAVDKVVLVLSRPMSFLGSALGSPCSPPPAPSSEKIELDGLATTHVVVLVAIHHAAVPLVVVVGLPLLPAATHAVRVLLAQRCLHLPLVSSHSSQRSQARVLLVLADVDVARERHDRDVDIVLALGDSLKVIGQLLWSLLLQLFHLFPCRPWSRCYRARALRGRWCCPTA